MHLRVCDREMCYYDFDSQLAIFRPTVNEIA
jgi:hypothetical protein